MQIYFIRHGETDWNLAKKVQGPQSSHLTEKGKLEAKGIKDYFLKQGINFDYVYYSPTLRTKETFELIFSGDNSLLANSTIEKPVIEEPDIEEREHWELIGLTKEAVEEKIGKKFVQRFSWELYFEGTEQSILTGLFPKDETIESVRKRVGSFVGKLKLLDPAAKVLVIGHSIFNQYILEYLRYGTVGVKKEGEFQENDEVRMTSVGPNWQVKLIGIDLV